MSKLAQILLISWLGCFGSPSLLFGQAAAADTIACTDVVYLKSGSILRGRVTDYQPGSHLAMRTNTGLNLRFDDKMLRKIVQDCPRQRAPRAARQPRGYTFRERGWYNATRLGLLAGDTYWGDFSLGAFAQHSAGWQFNRRLGIGIGAGAENFTPQEGDVATYPVFAEMRGYLLPRHLSPYFSLAGGYGFAGKIRDTGFDNRATTDWRGGWMAAARFGYRLGNHLTLDVGLRFQRKNRDWTSRWNPGESGTDRILNKRLEIAVGILI